MLKGSKKVVATCLAFSMVASQSATVLAQDISTDSEVIVLEDTEEGDLLEIQSQTEDFSETEEQSEEFDQEEVLEESSSDPEESLLSTEQRVFKEEVIESAGETNLNALVEGKDYVAGEVLATASSQEEAELIAKAYGGELKYYGYGVATISLESSEYTVASAFEEGISDDMLPAVEPNYINEIIDPAQEDALTDDAQLCDYNGSGWERSYYDFGFDDPFLNPGNAYGAYQWYHGSIGTYAAWGLSTGSPDVTVAVIDSGVLDTHEELTGKVTVPKDITFEVSHNADRVGHGTHVAGIIAAKAGNDVGGAGIAPDASILALNVSYYDPEQKNYLVKDDYVARAINYVAGMDASGKSGKRRADIINMSLGGSDKNVITEKAVENAYKAGVSVVVSMGNSMANDKKYPAAYDHVIAVAATDQSGQKAYFSSFGSWCDIAAPGHVIVSSYSSNVKGYAAMSGTSMAAPVVAGACALYMSVYGHVDPDTMEKAIKTSATKTSSKGIGAGVINLAGMFGGAVEAPTISLVKLNGSTKTVAAKASGNSVTVKEKLGTDIFIEYSTNFLKGDEKLNKQTKIVYTINGKDPAVKNGVVTEGEVIDYDMWHDFLTPVTYYPYDYSRPQAFTLKAALLSGNGFLSKVTTIKFTVVNSALKGTGDQQKIFILGQNEILPGTSATFKTEFYENASHLKTVKNRAVDWSVDSFSEEAGVKITAEGKLTVPEDFNFRTIEIHAAAKDNEKVFGDRILYVVYDKADSVKIDAHNPRELNAVTPGKKALTVTLFSTDIDSERFKGDERELELEVYALNKNGKKINTEGIPSYFSYSSSNPGVADVKYDSKTGRFTLKAVAPGNATVTFDVCDGSKKKASVKIKVINPASEVTLTTEGGQIQNIAYGKKAKVRANIGDTYGKPTVSKVSWSYRVGFYNANYEEFVDETTLNEVSKLKAMTFSNGKIKAGKKAAVDKALGLANEKFINFNEKNPAQGMIIEVTATATDGTGYSATRKYYVNSSRTYLMVNNNEKITIDAGDLEEVKTYVIQSDGVSDYEVTSSNPEIASAFSQESLLYITSHAKGTATVTVRALDGSNMKKKVKITVK